MSGRSFRIGVVAPSSRLEPATAEAMAALVAAQYPDGRAEVVFHPQCFESWGHFAGTDARRAEAFLEVANDLGFDALWFGRGGYGSGRIVEAVVAGLEPSAADKQYLGYSDAGAMLGALYGKGFRRLAHGPMANDIRRAGGGAAAARALAWLVDADPASLEPSVAASPAPTAAFNLMMLSSIVGTPWQPDLTGHILYLEEVSEYMYRIDRALFHVMSNDAMRRIAGLRLGRCSDVPVNDPDFAQTEEDIARYWCDRAGIPYLGRADIGHDADNRIVPFGTTAKSVGSTPI